MFVHKNAEAILTPQSAKAMSNIAQEERRKEADRLAAHQRPYPRDEGLRRVGRL